MKRKTTQEFIQDAIKIHGNKYDYSLVDYKNWETKVKIVCSVHGMFEQQPNNHLKNQGCPKCGHNISDTKRRKTTQEFIRQAREIHHHKYDYSLVEYKNANTKVKIICPIHGVFEQTPYSHLKHFICPKCSTVRRYTNSKRKTTQEFILDAWCKHGDVYNYSLVDYKNNNTKIKIICPVHGIFEQESNSHLQGRGCPKCASHISKQELQLQTWLKEYNIICNDRQIIKPLELDIVIPEHKIAIEYNGLYWHSEQQGKDRSYHLNKYNLCKEQGYRLITIWENEWLYKQDIVKSIILNSIGIHQRKIHGRKCIIKDVSPKEARIMYDNNHIQGFKGGLHHGLYYKDELVSLMSIDKRNELQRFVNLKYTLVHGAFSKLLKSYNLNYVYTFADTRYFTGNVYTKNGFEYVYTTKPNYYYIKKDTTFHRMLFQKKNIQKKYHQGLLKSFDINITEYKNMLNNGYDRIWDNGNRKYIMDT